MKRIVLLICIGLISLLGHIVQIGLPTATLTLGFIILNVVFIPIIMAFMLKFLLTFSVRLKKRTNERLER